MIAPRTGIWASLPNSLALALRNPPPRKFAPQLLTVEIDNTAGV